MNKEKRAEAQRTYPGVATDKADDKKVSECLVDQSTKMQNNNPRINEVKRKQNN